MQVLPPPATRIPELPPAQGPLAQYCWHDPVWAEAGINPPRTLIVAAIINARTIFSSHCEVAVLWPSRRSAQCRRIKHGVAARSGAAHAEVDRWVALPVDSDQQSGAHQKRQAGDTSQAVANDLFGSIIHAGHSSKIGASEKRTRRERALPASINGVVGYTAGAR
jgi:hypothetical protein